MNAQTTWEERYIKGETGWDRGSASQAAEAWLKHLRHTPCRLLAPGCGFGHEVIYFAEHWQEVPPALIPHRNGLFELAFQIIHEPLPAAP